MGSDIKTLGQHHLFVADVHSLALQFSKYFHANVAYGFQDKFPFDGKTFREGTYDIINLGKIETAIQTTTLSLNLYDEQYECKRDYAQWGDQFVEAYRKAEPHEDPFDSCYFCYKSNGEPFAFIQNDIFYYDAPYFSRWGRFCALFTGEYNNWESFMRYRRELRFGYARVGIREIVYVNDQGKEIDSYPKTWNDLLRSIEKYKTQGLHIPDFARDKKELPVNNYPLFFTDDFSDLE